MKTIWAVVDHDYQDIDPVKVVAVCRTKPDANRYVDEHWGYGYIIVAVPVPES